MTYTNSLLRREEYARLADVSIDGRILDVGGVPSAHYHTLIKGTHEFVTANIDPKADLVFDAEKPWPVESASFEGVLLMNIIEHLYDTRTTLAEARRVLVPGGTFVGTSPFMFNVHPSPDDFGRYTKSALLRMFAEAGFTDVRITELGTGAFSVVYHALIGFMRWSWLANLGIAMAKGMDRLLGRLKPGNKMSSEYFPLGYFIVATAPKSD